MMSVSDDYQEKPTTDIDESIFVKDKPGQVSGIICLLFGAFGAMQSGFFFLLLLLGTIIDLLDGAYGDIAILSIVNIISLAITAAFIKLLVAGVNRLIINSRLERYKKAIGTKGYIKLESLADYMLLPLKKVKKDIKYMLKHYYFVSGHLDREETTLMTSDSVYNDYVSLKEKMAAADTKPTTENMSAGLTTDNVNEEKNKAADSELSNEEREIIEEGKEYINKIRELNNQIPGEEMTDKLNNMESIVRRIIDQVKENPQSIKELNKLMKFYLPTTMKLLEAYARTENLPAKEGSNIKNTREEIEKSIDSINNAFGKVLDSMFGDVALDVSSDISLMKMMMNSDGLSEGDFGKLLQE